MYVMLMCAVLVLFVVGEFLWHGEHVPRSITWRAGFPMAAFALIGGAAQARGESFFVYSSMYALAFITAFVGPVFFAIADVLVRKVQKRR